MVEAYLRRSPLAPLGLAAQAATGLAPVGAGVLVYGAAARLLRLPEVDLLAAAVRRAGGDPPEPDPA